jgi:uncharacterized protein (DUF2342 family)
MEQYQAGERFVEAVLSARDRAFLHRVWEGPHNLPSLDEIRTPNQWIARLEGATVEDLH